MPFIGYVKSAFSTDPETAAEKPGYPTLCFSKVGIIFMIGCYGTQGWKTDLY